MNVAATTARIRDQIQRARDTSSLDEKGQYSLNQVEQLVVSLEDSGAVVAEFPAIDALGCLNQQPAGDTAGRWLRQDDDKAGLQECDICGGEKPAEMVSRTTLPEIAPHQADVCWVCEFSHGHTPAEGVCHECGECLNGGGFSIEIEYPLGVADLPARKTATLCGDCAEWTASDITHRGVGNDDVAGPRLGRLIDEEAARLRDLEAADE